jgi:hypothetical protein
VNPQWIIENDLEEAFFALPEQMFFNTGSDRLSGLSQSQAAGARGEGAIADASVRWATSVEAWATSAVIWATTHYNRRGTRVRQFCGIRDTTKSLITRHLVTYRVPIERPLRLCYA